MDVEEIRKRIEAEIKDTRELLEEYKEQSKPVAPDDSIGRLTRMEALGSKSVAENMLRRTQAKLDGLERALAQVGTPDFGTCTNCGDEIPLARILFQPESSVCVKCSR